MKSGYLQSRKTQFKNLPEFLKIGQSHLLFIHFSINSSAMKQSCRSSSCKVTCSPSCHMTNKIKNKINRFLYLDTSVLNLINKLLHLIRKRDLSEQFDCKDMFSLLLSQRGRGGGRLLNLRREEEPFIQNSS